LAENVIWGKGLSDKSEYRHMGEGFKIAQKPSYDIWTFPKLFIYLFFGKS